MINRLKIFCILTMCVMPLMNVKALTQSLTIVNNTSNATPLFNLQVSLGDGSNIQNVSPTSATIPSGGSVTFNITTVSDNCFGGGTCTQTFKLVYPDTPSSFPPLAEENVTCGITSYDDGSDAQIACNTFSPVPGNVPITMSGGDRNPGSTQIQATIPEEIKKIRKVPSTSNQNM